MEWTERARLAAGFPLVFALELALTSGGACGGAGGSIAAAARFNCEPCAACFRFAVKGSSGGDGEGRSATLETWRRGEAAQSKARQGKAIQCNVVQRNSMSSLSLSCHSTRATIPTLARGSACITSCSCSCSCSCTSCISLSLFTFLCSRLCFLLSPLSSLRNAPTLWLDRSWFRVEVLASFCFNFWRIAWRRAASSRSDRIRFRRFNWDLESWAGGAGI